MKYIDAEKISFVTGQTQVSELDYVRRYDIDRMPAADVAEVVRCRECHHMDLAYLYCHEWEAVTEEDGYCYKGEKE